MTISLIIDGVDCRASSLEGLSEVKGIQYWLKHHASS